MSLSNGQLVTLLRKMLDVAERGELRCESLTLDMQYGLRDIEDWQTGTVRTEYDGSSRLSIGLECITLSMGSSSQFMEPKLLETPQRSLEKHDAG